MDSAAKGKEVSLLGFALGFELKSPVILQVKGYSPMPYFRPQTLKKLQQDALGAIVGGVHQSKIFDVYAEWADNNITENEYSIICGNRRSAAKLLWRIRAMRRQKFWDNKWLKSSWLRLVTCLNQSIDILIKSSRGCFMHRVNR